MSYSFLIAQILGTIIFLINSYGLTKLTTSKVSFYNGLANGLSSTQYLLLGAYSGALCCIIAVVRNMVFSRYKKEIPLYVLIIYILVVLVFNSKLIHSTLDIIPIFNIIIFAITLWTKNIWNIKAFGVISCVDSVVYDYCTGAYATILTEVVAGIIGINCLIKLRKNKMTKQAVL